MTVGAEDLSILRPVIFVVAVLMVYVYLARMFRDETASATPKVRFVSFSYLVDTVPYTTLLGTLLQLGSTAHVAGVAPG